MTPERWAQVREVFRAVLEQPRQDRIALLERMTDGDPQLRVEVEKLLAHHADADEESFLHPSTQPAPDAGGTAAEAPTATGAGSEESTHSLEGEHPGRIGPYRVRDVLGEGGFGIVYLADQEQPVRRRVALKVIKLGMDSREIVARFEAERQALALMSHAGVAKVLDAGTSESGRPYFVMEHVRGVPITEYADRHRLSTAERLELFTQVCDAVQHAHQKGILHRDLKPSNVLVTDENGERVPKVIDFGIAKALHQRLGSHSVFTQQGVLIGTPAYMSPEQAEMTAEDVDTRSDIYSLGVMLYELLVGTLPFDTETLRNAGIAEIQRLICLQEPPRPSARLARQRDHTTVVAERRRTTARQLEREVRGELDWVTMKALEKDRVRRYSSASELAADVRRVLLNEPVLAGPPSTLYRLRKYYRRHRLALLSSAAVVVLLGIIAIGSWQASARRQHAAAERRSSDYHLQGSASFDSYRRLQEQVTELEGVWRTLRERERASPIWERREEVAAWKRYTQAREDLDRTFNDAVLFFSRAADAAPAGSELKHTSTRSLEGVYYSGYQQALQHGGANLSPQFFRSMVEALELGTYHQALRGTGRVLFESEPTGAEVFCFRYEVHEQRLIPLPVRVHGTQVVDGGPFLEVERVRTDTQTPLQPGDRLLSINEQPIAGLTDLAAAVSDLDLDGRVRVTFTRAEDHQRPTSLRVTLTRDWRPFSSAAIDAPRLTTRRDARLEAGRLLAPFDQLGISFRGYPLAFRECCRLGKTRAGEPLEGEFPPGSYLFVLRKPGHRDTRYPIAIPPRRVQAHVRLLPNEVAPEDLVHVPAGPVAFGGDSEAFQGRVADEADLGDFLIGRTEVRVQDYLAFVNDRKVYAAINADGKAPPRSPAARQIARDVFPHDPPQAVQIIPRGSDGKLYWLRDEDTELWKLKSSWDANWPVMGVPHVAALEYAHWLTQHRGGGLRYRLPTDLEWEKAARGVDRRFHVWGNYFVADFCNSALRRGLPSPVAISPLDESPYGVRDLAGSVEEPTSGRPAASLQYRSLRGGSWNVTDEYYFRCATRNGMLPVNAKRDFGIRLAADLPE